MKIPKIIHYVWCGKENLPPNFSQFLESWKKFCPDYEIKLWNENNFDFSKSPYAMEAYEKRKFGFVADYIRVKVLHEYGGFYFDTDIELIKPIDDLLNNDFVVSFENDVHLESAVLGSVPNHPFLKRMIEFYEKAHFLKPNGKPDLTPNTPIITNFLMRYYNLIPKNQEQTLNCEDDYTIKVLDKHAFAPINYTTKKIEITDQTYAIHHFDGSWQGGNVKIQDKFLCSVYKTFGAKTFAKFTKMYVNHVGKSLKKRKLL